MSKRVLITGSAGFIGSHTVQHFMENTDWELVCLDSFKHKGDSLRVSEFDYGWDRFKTYAADLSAPISDRLAGQIGHIDYIVNLASESHVDRSIEDPVPFVQNNINLALYMLEYARGAKPKTFIQISTDEVYGPAPIGVNHPEWSPIVPSNPYSASKAAQEALATAYWRSYGVPVIITNTMNNYGERQDPEKFVPMLIQKINAGEEVIIHGNENYIGSRFYLHARNHADAILFLLQNTSPTKFVEWENMVPDRYNIVGEAEVDNLALASLVAELMGKELKYKLVDFHSTRPGHDPRYALDGGKIADLGWQAPVEFRESLIRTINWTLERADIWL